MVPPSRKRLAPHPDPPADLHGRKLPRKGARGPWYRIHPVGGAPLHFGRTGDHRFDAPAGQFGVLYLGSSPDCAFVETLGHRTGTGLVTSLSLQRRLLARVSSSRSLKLVDLTGPGLARIGADNRLASSGDYRLCQKWSLAIHNHPQAPDGLLFRSRHDPSLTSIALFDRPAVRRSLKVENLGSFWDPKNRQLLVRILDDHGYAMIR